jgi:hypothetical protein
VKGFARGEVEIRDGEGDVRRDRGDSALISVTSRDEVGLTHIS